MQRGSQLTLQTSLPKGKIIIIDAYNMIHRCRFEWGGKPATGEYQIVYNFFRTLRALVEESKPTMIFFPLDGAPKARLDSFDDYKGNRKVDTTDENTVKYWESFHSQKRIIINAVKYCYPIISFYHPDYECDDVILHLVEDRIPKDKEAIIISSDTDFIQIINNHKNITLYNPITRSFRECTDYDYVSWKSMVGDVADNIPGVKGIGKKTATKILSSTTELAARLASDSFSQIYNRNYNLIELKNLSEGDLPQLQVHGPNVLDRAKIESDFREMKFESMLKESTLEKYLSTFENVA